MCSTVGYNVATPDPFPINSGVKQGCVLAPTLFRIFYSMLCSCPLARTKTESTPQSIPRQAVQPGQTPGQVQDQVHHHQRPSLPTMLPWRYTLRKHSRDWSGDRFAHTCDEFGLRLRWWYREPTPLRASTQRVTNSTRSTGFNTWGPTSAQITPSNRIPTPESRRSQQSCPSSTKGCDPTKIWRRTPRCVCTEPASWAHSSTPVKLGQYTLPRRRDWIVSICAASDAYSAYDDRTRFPTRTCLSAPDCPPSSRLWVSTISAAGWARFTEWRMVTSLKTCSTGNFQEVPDPEVAPDCDSKSLAREPWRVHQSTSAKRKPRGVSGLLESRQARPHRPPDG